MIGLTRAVRVFAYAGPIDMRRGFDGLAALVTESLGHDLLRGDVYLFVGKSRRRAKILYFDGTGLCLFAKRLEKGQFARLWDRADGGGGIELTLSELALFLEGSELVAKRIAPPSLLTIDLVPTIAA